MVIPSSGAATTPTFSTLPATLPAAFAFSCQRKPAPLSSASRNSLPETRSLRAALVAPIFGAARSRKSCNRSPRSFYNFPTTRSSIRATAKSPPSAESAPPIPFLINRRYSFSPPKFFFGDIAHGTRTRLLRSLEWEIASWQSSARIERDPFPRRPALEDSFGLHKENGSWGREVERPHQRRSLCLRSWSQSRKVARPHHQSQIASRKTWRQTWRCGLSPRFFLLRFPRGSKAARCRNHSRKIPHAFLDFPRCRFSSRSRQRQIRRQRRQKFRRPLDHLSQGTKIRHRTRRPRCRIPFRPYRRQSRQLQLHPHRPEIRHPHCQPLAKISRTSLRGVILSDTPFAPRRISCNPRLQLEDHHTYRENLIVLPNGVWGVRIPLLRLASLPFPTALLSAPPRPAFPLSISSTLPSPIAPTPSRASIPARSLVCPSPVALDSSGSCNTPRAVPPAPAHLSFGPATPPAFRVPVRTSARTAPALPGI